MRNSDPSENRLMVGGLKGVPFGLKPDGSFIIHSGELPFLPPPSRVVVGRNHLEIDGWYFSCCYVPKGLLTWLKSMLLEWAARDRGEENRLWLQGITAALKDAFVSNGHFG